MYRFINSEGALRNTAIVGLPKNGDSFFNTFAK